VVIEGNNTAISAVAGRSFHLSCSRFLKFDAAEVHQLGGILDPADQFRRYGVSSSLVRCCRYGACPLRLRRLGGGRRCAVRSGCPGASKEFAEDLYDPIEAGEQAPAGFRQVLKRDWIAPVYDPTFVEADQIDWPEEELVIGVDLEGEARAYPVGFLNRREIVIDMHRGIPTFVTW
jgi:hypothetical protein